MGASQHRQRASTISASCLSSLKKGGRGMELSDRWTIAVLDSLLHISGEIALSVHGQCVRTASLEPAACVHRERTNLHLYRLSFEAELIPWKPNKSNKHKVMSVCCGLSCMNVQKLECMHFLWNTIQLSLCPVHTILLLLLLLLLALL